LSKKYEEKNQLVDSNKYYKPEEALTLLKDTAWAKFTESVDLAVKLNVDIKKGQTSVRGTVDLPHGSGKKVRVAVITKGEAAAEAEAAGAQVVGAEDLVDKISKGFLDFDVLLATPDMMSLVGKLGKILGSKGLMPNPKSGTVTQDIGKAVKAFQTGKIEFRMDKGGVVHLLLGKANFLPEHLLANFRAVMEAVKHQKPSGTKGAFFKSATLSTTMGPGIRLDVREFAQ
jgi:large subunit ribosomal protein L1